MISTISPRTAAILLVLAPLGALGAALIAQFGFGLEPCHLCTLQRLPFAFAAFVAILASVEGRDERLRAMLLAVVALTYATNAGIAFYHSGVEWHWWESACSGAQVLSGNAGGLLAKLKQGPEAPACDMVPFALFGVLSFAGMNLIFSPVLAAFAAWFAREARRRA